MEVSMYSQYQNASANRQKSFGMPHTPMAPAAHTDNDNYL